MELCHTCWNSRICETRTTGQHFCVYLGKLVRFEVQRRSELQLDATEDVVWGTVGAFAYAVVRVSGVVTTFDVYVAKLPKGRIDLLPSASFRNRINRNWFRSEAAARAFLKEFLMTKKHVPEEEIGTGLLRTKWQRSL